jgi:uncharacterized membrane protein
MLGYSSGVFNALKYVHILAAMTWLGTSIYLQFTATRLAKANDPERMAAFAKDTEYTGTHLIMPSTILLLLMGIALVAYSPVYAFTQTWILLAFAAYAATFVTGGKASNVKADNPLQPRGTDIQGGESHHLVKGDVIVVPAGQPHWFKEVSPTVSYYVVKVIK